MIKPKDKTQLLNLCNQTMFREVFQLMQVMGVNSSDFHHLRKEFIHGSMNYQFSSRLKALIDRIENEIEDYISIDENILWSLCLENNSLDFYLQYQDTFPDGFYKLEAKRAIQSLELKFTQEIFDFSVSLAPVLSSSQKTEENTVKKYSSKKFDNCRELVDRVSKDIPKDRNLNMNNYEEEWVLCDYKTGSYIKNEDIEKTLIDWGAQSNTQLIVMPLTGENAYVLINGMSKAVPAFFLGYLLAINSQYLKSERFSSSSIASKVESQISEIKKAKEVLDKSNLKYDAPNLPTPTSPTNTFNIIQNISRVASQKISLGASFVFAGIFSTAILGVSKFTSQQTKTINAKEKEAVKDTCSANQAKIDSLKTLLAIYNSKPLNLDSIKKQHEKEKYNIQKMIDKIKLESKNSKKDLEIDLSNIQKQLIDCIDRPEIHSQIIRKVDTLKIPTGIQIIIKFKANSYELTRDIKKRLDNIKDIINESKNITCKIKIFARYQNQEIASKLDIKRGENVANYMEATYEFVTDLYPPELHRSIVIELLPKK